MAWLNIETAPKDGVTILVSDGDFVKKCHWVQGIGWCNSNGVAIGLTPICWVPVPSTYRCDEVDKNVASIIYRNLENDGSGFWLPEWCVADGNEMPTFEQFVQSIIGRGNE